MARHRSPNPLEAQRRAATDALFKVAKKHGLDQSRFPPFATIEDCRSALRTYDLEAVLRNGESFGCDKQTAEQLQQVLVLLDVAQMYAAGLASIQFLENHKCVHPKRQSAISLLSGLATDLGSISALIEHGYDVQARVITRTFGERLDLLVATQIDRAFAVAFVENSDIDDANEFWNREVARGKIVSRVSRRLRRLSLYGETPIDEEWRERRKEMTKWLSTATHPSYVAGWFAILPNMGEKHGEELLNGENGLFGQVGAVSISTGRAIFARLVEFLHLAEARRSFLGPSDEQLVEMKGITDRARKFLWKALGECYFAPNRELLEAYLAIHGYKLVELAGAEQSGNN